MYVDGVQAATVSGTLDATSQDYDYIGTGFVGGAWPDEAHSSTTSSTGYATYFNGDIGDVAYYPSELTAAQVTDQWNASQSSSGLTPVQTDTVTDPGGHTLTYTYDVLNGDRVLSQTDGPRRYDDLRVRRGRVPGRGDQPRRRRHPDRL